MVKSNHLAGFTFWLLGIVYSLGYEFFDSAERMVECTYDTAEGAKVCDCGFRNEHLTLPNMTGKVNQIRVVNCHDLRVKSGAFVDMRFVMSVQFENIGQLILEEYALEFREQFPTNKLRLQFLNVTFVDIRSHAIRGFIDRLELRSCEIFAMGPFAISIVDPTAFLILIDNSIIHRIESQAFKKVAVDKLEIINSAILSDLPSRTFYDLDIRDQFLLSNTTMKALTPNAFAMNKIKNLIFRNNTIERITGESLGVSIGQSIQFHQNNFGYLRRRAFAAITVSDAYKSAHSEPMDFILRTNNIIDQERPLGLIFSDDFKLTISTLNYKTPVTCDEADEFRNNFFLRQNEETVHFDFLTGNKNPDTYEDATESFSVSEILRNKCLWDTNNYVAVVSVLVTLIVLVILCAFVSYMYVRRRRKARKLDIIAPEGKTYRETQIILQVQNVGLLKTDL